MAYLKQIEGYIESEEGWQVIFNVPVSLDENLFFAAIVTYQKLKKCLGDLRNKPKNELESMVFSLRDQLFKVSQLIDPSPHRTKLLQCLAVLIVQSCAHIWKSPIHDILQSLRETDLFKVLLFLFEETEANCTINLLKKSCKSIARKQMELEKENIFKKLSDALLHAESSVRVDVYQLLEYTFSSDFFVYERRFILLGAQDLKLLAFAKDYSTLPPEQAVFVLDALLAGLEQLKSKFNLKQTNKIIIKSLKGKRNKKKRRKAGKRLLQKKVQFEKEKSMALFCACESLFSIFYGNLTIDGDTSSFISLAYFLSELFSYIAQLNFNSNEAITDGLLIHFQQFKKVLKLGFAHAEIVLCISSFWCSISVLVKENINFQTKTFNKVAIFGEIIQDLIEVTLYPTDLSEYVNSKTEFTEFREDVRAVIRHIAVHSIGLPKLFGMVKSQLDPAQITRSKDWRFYESIIHCFSSIGNLVKARPEMAKMKVEVVFLSYVGLFTVRHFRNEYLVCSMLNSFCIYKELLQFGKREVSLIWFNLCLFGLLCPQDDSDGFNFVSKEDHASVIAIMKVLPLAFDSIISSLGITVKAMLILIIELFLKNVMLSDKSKLIVLELINKLSSRLSKPEEKYEIFTLLARSYFFPQQKKQCPKNQYSFVNLDHPLSSVDLSSSLTAQIQTLATDHGVSVSSKREEVVASFFKFYRNNDGACLQFLQDEAVFLKESLFSKDAYATLLFLTRLVDALEASDMPVATKVFLLSALSTNPQQDLQVECQAFCLARSLIPYLSNTERQQLLQHATNWLSKLQQDIDFLQKFFRLFNDLIFYTDEVPLWQRLVSVYEQVLCFDTEEELLKEVLAFFTALLQKYKQSNNFKPLVCRYICIITISMRQRLKSHNLDVVSRILFEAVEVGEVHSRSIFQHCSEMTGDDKLWLNFNKVLANHKYSISYQKFRSSYKVLCAGKKKRQSLQQSKGRKNTL